MIRSALFLTAMSFGLSACDSPNSQSYVQVVHQTAAYSVAPPNAPSGPVVDTFARDFLNGIQARSFAEKREYCGYFFVNAAGELQGSPPRPGTYAACDMPAPRKGQRIIASYHTHGSYGPGYDNEVPSIVDLRSDFDFGLDGYVATPGGRVWLVDFQTRSTWQLCGRHCITSDPNFRAHNEAGIHQVYTIETLQQRRLMF